MKRFAFGAETFLAENPMMTVGELLEQADKEVGFCGTCHFTSGSENRDWLVDHEDTLLEEVHDVRVDLLVEAA